MPRSSALMTVCFCSGMLGALCSSLVMWKSGQMGLPALLDAPIAYLGIIGSRRRWETTRQALLESGLPPEKLEHIRSPIGLELNVQTPEEIAVSIMAEILMLREGGDGLPMTSQR